LPHIFFHHFRKQIWDSWQVQLSLKVSLAVLFPACLLKSNSQEMCLRNFDPLQWFIKHMLRCYHDSKYSQLFLKYNTTNGRTSPNTFQSHAVPLLLFFATYLTKPTPKIQHTSLSHCVQCALFLSPQNTIHCMERTR